MITLNDVHSGLNATAVARVVRPGSVADLREAVVAARSDGLAVAVHGGRHAMGGQQFAAGAVAIDMGGLDQIVGFDPIGGTVEVEAGIQWPELMRALAARQGPRPRWGVAQKQTGADRLSIGGALAANIHGRGLAMRPIVQDVEAFTLVDAEGALRRCSRDENRELFALAIGGYGLIGAIATVTLRLAPRRRLVRLVDLIDARELAEAFAVRIREGALYGDFQFMTDEGDERYLRAGVFSCYAPTSAEETVKPGRELDADDWRRLYRLAHHDRGELYEVYSAFYRSTHGQTYWSDEHQLSVYLDRYHDELDREDGCATRRSEMITEVYVPRAALGGFLEAARADFLRHRVPLIYGTVRLVERDDETVLAWARQDWACIVINLCVAHDEPGLTRAAADFRRLIDLAIGHGGSYYLTYHRWATRAQAEAAHPRLREFLERKRELDPRGIFQSDWFRHHAALLGLPG
jgi:FAD/FMN-containing dehydrogenase